jgi:uncharacterized membrane protein
MGHELAPLLGVAVLAVGFALRLNPLLAVVLAAFGAGLAGGMGPLAVLAALGRAFNANRYVSLVWLVLPVVALLERFGLQVRAHRRMAYLAIRQLTAALGLTALGGQAQMVRPLVAPMAQAAAERQAGGALSPSAVETVRAHAAAVDNIGAFFGEDVFIAMSSILLIRGALEGLGVTVEPLRLSLWAIPTALAAFAVHGFRLWRLDVGLSRPKAPRP